MPLARTFIPDLAPSGHVQAPPDASNSNLPADASVWAAARRSYVEDGCSCPVAAERHGLNTRTVQHRAAREGWPAMRAAYHAAERRMWADAEAAAASDDPASALVQDLRAGQLADLLVDVSGDALVKAAARLAAEAAAAGRPQETLVWLRAVREAARVADEVDRALAGDPASRFRTAYFRGLHDACVADPPPAPEPVTASESDEPEAA